MNKRVVALLIALALSVTGCFALPANPVPPYLVLLTPLLPVTAGQCTGIVVAPTKILAPRHCPNIMRAVTATGQEAWIASIHTSEEHDLAVLTTDRPLWVSRFAKFAHPQLGVDATIFGYCPYMVNHVARHAFYNGLTPVPIQGWPEYDYGMWVLTLGKVCPGDSGSPIIQGDKVVGVVSLYNDTQIYMGKLAYAVPIEYALSLIEEVDHATSAIEATH